MNLHWRPLVAALALQLALPAQAFDHDYRDFGTLLAQHVRMSPDKTRSEVDYAALKQDRAALKAVLDEWSSVSEQAFSAWTRDQQMAFLINAYNGFTLELILTRYPNLKSIRDLGSLFRSAWKIEFFTLLGQKRHLDWVEHEKLRPEYPDPRIHFAVNCASIGCPALQDQAFVAEMLDTQLTQVTRQFLRDRERNRFDAKAGTLMVTPLLRWYAEDFAAGRGKDVTGWLATQAEWLTDSAAERERIAQGDFRIRYTDYDWGLNDVQ